MLKSLHAKGCELIFVSVMSKKLIWIVAVFMGLAMISLILVQAYWIRNAVLIKETYLDQLIQRSIIDIADEIEDREIAEIITDQTDHNPGINGLIASPSGNSRGTEVQSNRKNTTSAQVSNDSGGISANTNPENEQEEWLKNRRERVDRVISEMLYASPSIEDRISPPEVEDIIHNVLNRSGIHLPFEYSITRWNNETVFGSPGFSPVAEAEYYKVQLFKDDIYNNPNFLTIYFPDKNNFLFESLSYLALSSSILTLVILVSFVLTLIIMFRQKRLSEIRNDFVSNMTHELKTPISTISLASQMLGDKSIPDEIKNAEQISKIITEECRRLGSQVEKVLQTAIFDKGKLKLRLSEVNIHEIITGVIENFSIQVKSRNGKITSSLQAKNYMLQVDQVHFTNLLSNLLDNAIKYCNRNPEIEVDTSDRKDYFMVSVRDNGIGIAKNELKRIFEKFYRVPTGNVHTVKGFGLGLSYVKMIAEEHHGYVEVDSEIYQGSTFKVFLPLKDTIDYAKD